jgi:hypothetical protein
MQVIGTYTRRSSPLLHRHPRRWRPPENAGTRTGTADPLPIAQRPVPDSIPQVGHLPGARPGVLDDRSPGSPVLLITPPVRHALVARHATDRSGLARPREIYAVAGAFPVTRAERGQRRAAPPEIAHNVLPSIVPRVGQCRQVETRNPRRLTAASQLPEDARLAAIVPSTPLTKRLELSPPYCFAISTASLMAAFKGTSGSCNSS